MDKLAARSTGQPYERADTGGRHRPVTTQLVVGLLLACLLALAAAGLDLGIANRAASDADPTPVLSVPASPCFAVVGALSLSRRPRHLVGRLCAFASVSAWLSNG